MRALLAALVLSGCSADCSGGDVHSEKKKTPDGGTTLTAGPFDWKCSAKIDGAAVAQGIAMPVKPGRHVVSCDAERLEVVVRAGEAVTVDYFGP